MLSPRYQVLRSLDSTAYRMSYEPLFHAVQKRFFCKKDWKSDELEGYT